MTSLPSHISSVGRQPDNPPFVSRQNVGDIERLLCGLTGTALIMTGLTTRPTWRTAAMTVVGGSLLYVGAMGQNPIYSGLGIRLVRTFKGRQRVEVIKSLTINRPVEELFAYWRDFRNLPRIMRHLGSVEILSDKRSRWRVTAPAGLAVEWDATIVNEKKNTLIAWESCDGADIANWGAVRFAPAPKGRGTEVTVELEYEPIGGSAGAAFAKLFGEEPAQQIHEDLRRFKQFMETGEIPTTTGQPRGRSRPARASLSLS